jgi:hypothetical protein
MFSAIKISIIFLLFSCLFCLDKFDNKKKTIEIERYQSKVRTLDLDIWINRDIFELDLKKLDKDEIIAKRIRLNMKKYIESHKQYGFPELICISKQLFMPFIKNFKFFYISGNKDSPFKSIPKFILAISRDKNIVYRFGRLEVEPEKKLFSKIKISDIKHFNKLIKNEEIKVTNNECALDICSFFTKLAYSIDTEVIFSVNQIEERFMRVFRKKSDSKEIISRFGEISRKKIDIKERIEKLSSIITPPSFDEKKMKFRIKFFAFSYSTLIREWHFDVFRNGKINLIEIKDIY